MPYTAVCEGQEEGKISGGFHTAAYIVITQCYKMNFEKKRDKDVVLRDLCYTWRMKCSISIMMHSFRVCKVGKYGGIILTVYLGYLEYDYEHIRL